MHKMKTPTASGHLLSGSLSGSLGHTAVVPWFFLKDGYGRDAACQNNILDCFPFKYDIACQMKYRLLHIRLLRLHWLRMRVRRVPGMAAVITV